MTTRRSGLPVNGWLIIDKPSGMSSAKVVSRVKGITRARKAGHGGTLDPMATGVLPVALGEATKTTAHALTGSKTYEFTVRWGEARTTDDLEGEVVESSVRRPKREEILAALPLFSGVIRQVPPAFSAIKVEGKRSYALARKGRPPELAEREVHIYQLDLLATDGEDLARFRVECGGGTYVRALARDMAAHLGTFGHLVELRRTRVSAFGEDRAISLDKLQDMWQFPAPCEDLLPVMTALADIPALALTGPQAERLRSGQTVAAANVADGTVCAVASGNPVALAEVRDGTVRPLRVFNL